MENAVAYLVSVYHHTHLLNIDSIGGDLVGTSTHAVSGRLLFAIQEFKPNDELLVLAGTMLTEAAQDKLAFDAATPENRWEVRQCLTRTLACIEEGLERSPNNYHLMGLRVKIAAALGLPRSLAVTVVENMRVKHVQYYSMFYTLIPYLLHYGRYKELHEICWVSKNHVQVFYVCVTMKSTQHINTSVDPSNGVQEFSRRALQNGNFSKVSECEHSLYPFSQSCTSFYRCWTLLTFKNGLKSLLSPILPMLLEVTLTCPFALLRK